MSLNDNAATVHESVGGGNNNSTLVLGPGSIPSSLTGSMSSIRAAPIGNKKGELKHPCGKNWLIHLHYVRREFGTCKSIIHEELQKSNGNSEYANYILALIYRSEGKMQESLDKLQVCHELEPTNSNTVKQIARSLFLLGRHKLAVDAYQKAQMLHEDSDSESFYNMGMCYLFMKDLDKAKDYMNLSLQSRVSHEAFEASAQIALAKMNVNDAISVYEKAARVFPENPDILSNLGVLYMKIGKDDVSFSRLGCALAFDPYNSRALVAMAAMMQTHEDYEHALAKYKVAMQSLPDSASVWNNVGMCFFFGKKKYVAAISCLKRAYYLSPFDWKILHNLGLAHLHMQQYASAFHFLTASINLKPDQSHNFMLLAVAISHLEDIDYARHAYEQAIKLNAQDATTDPLTLQLNYAISLLNHKQHAEAHKKLLGIYDLVDEIPKGALEPEIRDAIVRAKSTLTTMGYDFPPDKNPHLFSTPTTSAVQREETAKSNPHKRKSKLKHTKIEQSLDKIEQANDLV